MMVLATMLLCGCGRLFTCSWCNQKVMGVPHTGNFMGQEISLCEGCYDAIMALSW